MSERVALVCLSGGMDSTFLLHQAMRRHKDVRCVFFRYGQANYDAECEAVYSLADRHMVDLHEVSLLGAVQGVIGRMGPVPEAGNDCGVSTANMPARNLLFIGAAASLAATLWGDNYAAVHGTGKRCMA